MSPLPPVDLQNLAIALMNQGRYSEAIPYLQQAIRQTPKHESLHHNLGIAYLRLGDSRRSLLALEQARRLNPNFFPTLETLGQIYLNFGRPQDALTYLLKAYQLNPRSPALNLSLGIAYLLKSDFKHSLTHLKSAHKLNPQDPAILAALIYAYFTTCSWSQLKPLLPQLHRHLQASQLTHQASAEIPFYTLVRSTSLAENLYSARSFSRQLEAAVPKSDRLTQTTNRQTAPKSPLARPQKLRLGYYSFDFHNHVNAHHLIGLLSQHHRDQFEVHCLAYDVYNRADPITALFERSVDYYHNLHSNDPKTTAQKIHDLNLDILVDINGHTTGNRLAALAYRPAPIQVEFLGFPGTTGANFIDYLIADARLIPKSDTQFYSEKIAYLPDCYLPVSYSHLEIPKAMPRRQYHLPDDAIVLACFNQSFKLDPSVFNSWLSILKKVPQTILWLYADNQEAKNHLVALAVKAGIQNTRLIFANRVSLVEHLSRLSVADLALDTFRYNGGGTTTDCLNAGLPVITKTGSHYPSRMTTAILTAAGLEQLITTTPEQYTNLTLKLVTQPRHLKKLKLKIKNLKQSPLFDLPRYTQNLESLYLQMHRRRLAGLPPVHLSLTNTNL